jgi:hypothetical protein
MKQDWVLNMTDQEVRSKSSSHGTCHKPEGLKDNLILSHSSNSLNFLTRRE